MNNDLDNILPQGSDENKVALLQSLEEDNLPEAEYETAADSFEADAKEGLQYIDKAAADKIVMQLNKALAKQVKRKEKRRAVIPNQNSIYIIILTLLLLIIISYLVIKKMQLP